MTPRILILHWIVRIQVLAVVCLALTGCIPLMPLGDLVGGADPPPPAITVSPVIYVVGPDATLTVDSTPDLRAGADTPPAEGAGGEPASSPTPAAGDPGLMLRLSPDAAAAPGDLAATLREAEGFSPTIYPDPNGIPHIGYGHQLTPAEAEALLAADMATARAAAARVVGEPAWGDLDEARRDVLVEMAFMAGEEGLAGFRRMLGAVRVGDIEAAADEILASRLAEQLPDRARRLAAAMREGAPVR